MRTCHQRRHTDSGDTANDDITYRVYDYDRLQNGKPRQLHVEQSIDVIEAPFKTADIDTFTEEIPGAVHTHFVTCKFYSVDKYDIDGVFTLDAKNIILM